jgi:hypothetical protein
MWQLLVPLLVLFVVHYWLCVYCHCKSPTKNSVIRKCQGRYFIYSTKSFFKIFYCFTRKAHFYFTGLPRKFRVSHKASTCVKNPNISVEFSSPFFCLGLTVCRLTPGYHRSTPCQLNTCNIYGSLIKPLVFNFTVKSSSYLRSWTN